MVAPDGTLTVVGDTKPGPPIRLASSTVVGRAPGCDVRLENQSVSRRHARIFRDGESGYVLLDLGSRNGTTVQNETVTRRRLADGDRIGMGTVLFRFALSGIVDEASPAS